MLTRLLPVCAAALLLAPTALADGGPDPGVLQAGAGIVDAAGGVRFVTMPAGSMTTLEAIATHGGNVLGSRLIRGGWGIPLIDYTGTAAGLSPDAQTLVLAQSGYDGHCNPHGCTPLRRTTSFQIINPKTLRRRITITLQGDFAFDALSPSGKRLYLIEHTSTANTDKYVVRGYDLEHHRLLAGTIADRTQRGWIMQGIPMARATSPSGRYVYTLYADPGGYPFVHALDTVAGHAHCIGIPWTNKQAAGDLDLVKLSNNQKQLTIGTTTAVGQHIYFQLDTRSYHVTPVTPPNRGGFPGWTLAPLIPLLAASTLTARKRHTKRHRNRLAPALPRGA